MSETLHYRVRHHTEYRYGAPVTNGQTVAHLLVRETEQQHVLDADLDVDPLPDHRVTHIDVFGNLLTYLAVQRPHHELTLTATSDVEVTVPDPPAATPAWDDVSALLADDDSPLALLACQCTLASPLVTPDHALAQFARPSFPPERPLHEAVADLCHRIFEGFTFDPRATDVTTPPADVLSLRRGVCQDFAHLAIGCLRSLGLPARYVSGYIETQPPAGEAKLVGTDASHAWCAVYAPGWGWLDLDPTNDHMPPDRHVTLGWGRDYSDVAPVRGVVYGPATTQTLAVAVDVTRV
jgi:transglutaminase-like putative cysteine protease